jgi:hypothetical protein
LTEFSDKTEKSFRRPAGPKKTSRCFKTGVPRKAGA